MRHSIISRRSLLAGFAAGLATPLLGTPAFADLYLDASELGLLPLSGEDQSAALQAAIEQAHLNNKGLLLPAGMYRAANVTVPAGMSIVGTAALTSLAALNNAPILKTDGASAFHLENLGFVGFPDDTTPDGSGLLEVFGSGEFTITRCRFRETGGTGIGLYDAQGTITDCDFLDLGDAGIHSFDSRGLMIFGNRIRGCGNAGIRIWRETRGRDGSIVTGNRIEDIDWKGGGNGQTGNGINLYFADEVIVADNHISDCAFTAVRANSCNNTQIRGNTCLDSGEVAIFSEFAFSGSVIADNIIDGAATGISITNLDSGGHLATCTGNIVRNITDRSAVNPDTRPVGIYAEAETVISGNTIESVPGIGILAGYGGYVRNVVVASNVLSAVTTGIGVSVVTDPPPGPVSVSGNLIGAPHEHGIVGMQWDKIVSDDLVRDAANYRHVTLSGNVVG